MPSSTTKERFFFSLYSTLQKMWFLCCISKRKKHSPQRIKKNNLHGKLFAMDENFYSPFFYRNEKFNCCEICLKGGFKGVWWGLTMKNFSVLLEMMREHIFNILFSRMDLKKMKKFEMNLILLCEWEFSKEFFILPCFWQVQNEFQEVVWSFYF
jgi:hypothetical protein